MTMTAIDQRQFRNVAGKFPSGVTVITTSSGDGIVHGMTANGFVSVSLDPPLILVSIGHTTRMHEHLMRNERYAVNILGHEQKAIAMHFAGKPQDTEPEFERINDYLFVPGVIGRIGCRIVDRHRAGDHTLMIGEVEHLDFRDGELPLVFSSGQLFSPLERPIA
jgi:flavin reductase (DIM6/NTAB) family NADH-FMN oxidoreductase RutF